MNFEQRKAEASRLLVNFLEDFSPPRGLDASQLASRIASAADAFARRMPVKGDFSEAVSAVMDRVRDTHMSNSWPPQAVFVMAMPAGESFGPRAAETFSVKNPAELLIQRMAENEPVSEPMLWGKESAQARGEDLERYRNACVERWMKVYKQEARGLMVAKYGPVVSSYFPEDRRAAQ